MTARITMHPETMHPELSTLFAGFDQAGLRWCVLRLPSEEGNSGGDVDLLVDRVDLHVMRGVLESRRFAQLPGWSGGEHYLSYHRPTDRWLWIHVVVELSFGPRYSLGTQSEAGCLDRRVWEHGWPELAPADAFWVLLFHRLADKRAIATRHRGRLAELANSPVDDSPLARVADMICPDGWGARRLVECARAGNWASLERMAPDLVAAWMRHDRIGPRRMLALRAGELLKGLVTLPRRRGLGVALIGPDGAGKTTLIAGIERSFGLPVRSVYMGLTGGLLPRVDRLTLPVLVVPGRLAVFWARYLVAKYHQARGRLVVFDRYVYDANVPTPYPLSWLGRTYRRVDGHACPPPDLVLVLSAPGTVMHERKGEYTPEMLEDWRQSFLALQRTVSRLEVVDTTRSRDEVRADVVERIWSRYVERWCKG